MSRIVTLGISSSFPRFRRQDDPVTSVTRRRLERGFSYLENLEYQRAHGHDSVFGRLMEQRIIWRELIELEVQDVDQEINRISAASRESQGYPHG